MAHCPAEHKWIEELVERFSPIINEARMLEIGSAIENHSGFFPTAKEYIGLDVASAGGVNVVSVAHLYDVPDGSFDIVCSFSELEHDMFWKKTLKKMVRLIRSGGLIIFSCCLNWEEHGTNRTSPKQSLTTQINNEEWGNYYRNVTPKDIENVWNIPNIFSDYFLGTNPYDDGLTAFWGIKK